MAIRTKDAEVLKPVVFTVAIDVVQLERYRSTAPLGQPASLTSMLLESLRYESSPELRARERAVSDDDLFEGRGGHAWPSIGRDSESVEVRGVDPQPL
jgi:hypothetical protein